MINIMIVVMVTGVTMTIKRSKHGMVGVSLLCYNDNCHVISNFRVITCSIYSQET